VGGVQGTNIRIIVVSDVDDLDDLDDEDDVNGNLITGTTARAVLEHVVTSLVEEPDDVRIDVDDSGRRVRLSVRVGPDDMGRVIGRRGRVAQAIRTVVRAAAVRDGIEVDVEFED
jgi:predicted RNA-binding protein YlqC (UPF0109 family)